MVITLDKRKQPLGVCTERRARKLIENGRACVYRYFPFIIILKDRDVREMEDLPQYRIKIDPGAKYTGIAVVRIDTDECVFCMQVEHHPEQIVKKLKTRRAVRNNRRQRETRYRKPKFKKGQDYESPRPEGWLPPSVRATAEGIINWVRRLGRWFNVTECSFEANRFDTQLMDNPDISGKEYQHGTLFGYEIREYLLDRFGHNCQYCGGKSGDNILEWEHIVPKSKGGSDRVGNATLACKTCNWAKGDKSLKDWLAEEQQTANGRKGSRKRRELAAARVCGIQKVMKGQVRGVSDRYCAWANNLRSAAEKKLFDMFGEVECASGGRTKYNRTMLGLPKAHHYDALCVGDVPAQGYVDRTNGCYLHARSTGRGSRCRNQRNACGIITNKYPQGPKRKHGLLLGDIVRVTVAKGNHPGTHIGRVLPKSSGAVEVKTTQGYKIGTTAGNCSVLQPGNGYDYSICRV